MLLPRFTRLISSAVLLLLVAGCASVPGGTSKPEARDVAQGPVREVPARAQTMYEQAAASMAAGDLIDAELRFKEFLLTYPDFPGAHVNLAIIHSANGNDASAMDAVNAALAIDAEHVPALNQLGVLHRKNGNFTESEAAYLKAITVQPDYPLAHYNLGVLNELYLQRLDMALQHFERYQELVGEDKQVGRWITDLQRRVAASQRTANVTE
ncbi:MAG: tetratricopeptide repeat protein [Pseudomonadota bacterium]